MKKRTLELKGDWGLGMDSNTQMAAFRLEALADLLWNDVFS